TPSASAAQPYTPMPAAASPKGQSSNRILPLVALIVVIGVGGYALVTWGIPFVAQNQSTLLSLVALLLAVAAGWYLRQPEFIDRLRARLGLRPRRPSFLETISPPSWYVDAPYEAQPVSPATPLPFAAAAPPPPAVTPEPIAKTAPPPPAPEMRTLQSLQ